MEPKRCSAVPVPTPEKFRFRFRFRFSFRMRIRIQTIFRTQLKKFCYKFLPFKFFKAQHCIPHSCHLSFDFLTFLSLYETVGALPARLTESDVMCCVGRSRPGAQYVRGGHAAGGALPTRCCGWRYGKVSQLLQVSNNSRFPWLV